MQYFNLVHIKPKDGKRVLDPLTMKPLPKEGLKLDFSPHWKRRENDGDVTITALVSNKTSKQKNNKQEAQNDNII